MSDVNGSPYKLQASKNSNDGWILVAKGDSEEELEFGIEIIKRQLEKLQDPADTFAPKVFCKVEGCGAEADERKGVKNGKPWKGVFCRVHKEHVIWLH